MIYRITKNYESGGAGLCTTVDEYTKVLEALANGGVGRTGGRILKQESVLAIGRNWLTEQELADFSRTGKEGYGYGLGVRVLIDGTNPKARWVNSAGTARRARTRWSIRKTISVCSIRTKFWA